MRILASISLLSYGALMISLPHVANAENTQDQHELRPTCGYEALTFIKTWFPEGVAGCDIQELNLQQETYACTIRQAWLAPKSINLVLSRQNGCLVLR